MRVEVLAPPLFIKGVVRLHVLEIKKRIKIRQPVNSVLDLIAKLAITQNEIAAFKVFQHDRQHFSIEMDLFPYFRTSHALFVVGEQLHHLYIVFRMGK